MTSAQRDEQRVRAYLGRRDDPAGDVALQVRSVDLNTQETRLRVPVARETIRQAEENVRVAWDRYLQRRRSAGPSGTSDPPRRRARNPTPGISG